jgi:hypothetical protein
MIYWNWFVKTRPELSEDGIGEFLNAVTDASAPDSARS